MAEAIRFDEGHCMEITDASAMGDVAGERRNLPMQAKLPVGPLKQVKLMVYPFHAFSLEGLSAYELPRRRLPASRGFVSSSCGINEPLLGVLVEMTPSIDSAPPNPGAWRPVTEGIKLLK